VVLVPAAFLKVALLPANAFEETRQDGLLWETVKLASQISLEAGLVLGTSVNDVNSAITEDRPQQFIGSQNLPKPVKYYHRKSKAKRGFEEGR
jgi:hypothetical protein